ncbi:GntR family transcriptional regulator [Halobacillus litoralis]|uniref:GntR family transcriptional regulator n=1 Tax=Halobacillus litoralis TaxID=45668 RepID=UPI001CFDFA23|nr:GntR family transcriptional regulator [Halobacillus litoralis]
MNQTIKEKQSRSDDVYHYLKKRILFKEIAPGSQLVENNIGQELDVSRTPIRNAIKKLETEGLVKVYSNRGAFVVQPTIEEIQQAFDMRRHLEKMTLWRVYNQMTEQDLAQLEEWLEREKRSYAKKDILEYLDVNKSFHMTLALKTDNPFLIDFTERILNQMNVYLMLYDVFLDENLDEDKRIKEHELIINALRKKDINQLLSLMNQHMEGSLESLCLNESDRKTKHIPIKKSL